MGKKKDIAKALKREREIEAELARRAEAKAAKKSKKKSKGKAEKPSKKKGKKAKADRPVDFEKINADDLGVMTIEAEAPIAVEPIAADDPAIAYAREVAASLPAEKPKKKSKRDEKIDPETGETRPEVIADRKAEREVEQAKLDAEIKARVQAKRAARAKDDVTSARNADALDGESEVEYQQRKLREKSEAEAIGKAAVAVEALKQAVDVVETERGRIFEAGESVAAEGEMPVEDFAKPSEAGPELEEGRNGYKIIMLDAEGKPDLRKVRQLTRVTTFVGNIDDETMLRQWEKRLLAEGISAAADEYAPRVNDIVHRREVAVAKARKADRKGKLGVGELADLETAANKASKDALNALIEEALEAAGRNTKADAGTNLHALAEISDEKGIDAVREMYEAGDISATDLASIEAYAERMTRLGAKVIESEAVIVNDDLGYAGRLDRIIMARLPALKIKTAAGDIVRPADARARRYVADIKSGRVDLGAGKISRQLAAYALGDLYDLETGERSRHSATRDIALVFHLPQGAGTCAVHAVDIKTGAMLLKLSAEVRRARNTGKKTIDTSVDITDPEPESEGE